MTYIILIFAAMMLLAGVIILVSPGIIFGLMKNHSKSLALHIFAVAVRLVIGVALIASAQSSKLPLTLDIIGWLFIAVGIFFCIIGRARFVKIVEWGITLLPSYGRVSGVFAILFAGLLGYAAI